MRVWGRVQSREYTKKVSETECEKRVAYEVSISKLEEGNRKTKLRNRFTCKRRGKCGRIRTLVSERSMILTEQSV